MNIFEEHFLARTPKSQAMFERSSRYLPGGVAGVMASSHPLFISAAHTDQHVSEVLEAAKHVLTQMAE